MTLAGAPATTPHRPRIAIVHDYLTQLGGAERVAGQIARIFPEADLYTTLHDRTEVQAEAVGGRPWSTSFLQPSAGRVPLKPLLPLISAAVASLDLCRYDLVISSSSGFAHHARIAAGATHVCYCSAPPHFLWQQSEYFRERPALRRALSPLLAYLQQRDREAAQRVDRYIAVSNYVAGRIREIYGREAAIIYPPVEVERFQPSDERSGRFLVLSRLVPAKRVDLVVRAANLYGLPLDVIGKGLELRRLRRLAGPTVRVLGWQPDERVREALATCIGAVIAGVEDFGLVTAEAQSSGRPPIAFAGGGALEIVEDGHTGFLFDEATPAAIAAAMLRARDRELDSEALVASARRFDVTMFRDALLRELLGNVTKWSDPLSPRERVGVRARGGAAGFSSLLTGSDGAAGA